MPLMTHGYDADRVAQVADELFELGDTQMSKVRKAGGWSRKQILGHLIDSSIVNHKRIIESQLTDSIYFKGYAHQQWVELQGYQQMDWEEIVTLWCALNMQLCTIVERIPSETIDKMHVDHSYHETAFNALAADEPSTLGYLIADYFAHLQYHLDQILEK